MTKTIVTLKTTKENLDALVIIQAKINEWLDDQSQLTLAKRANPAFDRRLYETYLGFSSILSHLNIEHARIENVKS